jgi:hypothetical protein
MCAAALGMYPWLPNSVVVVSSKGVANVLEYNAGFAK